MKYWLLLKENANKHLKIFFLALCIMLITWYVSANWYQLLLIHGESMNPTYSDMQFVLIDKHSDNYTYSDVIAFKCDSLDSILIKRIAACPGDKVIIRDGTLYINEAVSSVFPKTYSFEYAGIAETVILLTEGQYFVIGDNITESRDSRYAEIGCVNQEHILGKTIK